jgi:hypothetical protein
VVDQKPPRSTRQFLESTARSLPVPFATEARNIAPQANLPTRPPADALASLAAFETDYFQRL